MASAAASMRNSAPASQAARAAVAGSDSAVSRASPAGPIRLATRLPSTVAISSRRSRCRCASAEKRRRSGVGKYSTSSGRSAGSSGSSLASMASVSQSLATGSSAAISGRVSASPAAIRAAIAAASGRPATARSSSPADSSRVISSACAGSASAPAASSRLTASDCSTLSASTCPASSSVISASSASRPCMVSAPEAVASASRILMFTSWSEVLTPAELSSASVFSRTPGLSPWARAASIRPAWVMPRLAPSPSTRARSWLPLTRSASLARSPASAWVSPEPFT
ncbi:hypothetical protein ROTAS13_04462 [Roseomonas sp. TAS13]|nr:hypothetical protein ROTAS13_04462 [Roseomonas sp. TAS13]